MHMTTISRSTTLADVLTWAKANAQSRDAIYELEKVPVRLSGLHDEELHLVSADLGHFEQVIAPSPYGAVAPRSTNLDAAQRRGNSRLRALLERFHASTSPQAVVVAVGATARAEWNDLIAWVEAREGFTAQGAMWTKGKHRSLTMPRARFAVGPAGLTQAMVDSLVPSLTSEDRDTLCKSVRLLNKLRACAVEYPEIGRLVPGQDLVVPPGSSRARRIEWNDFPAPFRASFDAVAQRTLASPDDLMAEAEARLAAGEDPGEVFAALEDEGRSKRRLPENRVTALNGYRWAVTWLVRAAEDRGTDTSALCDVREVMTYAVIKAATDDQVRRSREAPDLKDPIASETLENRLTNLRTLARHGLRDDALVKIIDGIKRLTLDLPRSKRRAADLDAEQADADRIAELLHRHPHVAVALVNAPDRLSEIADRDLAQAWADGNLGAELTALRLHGAATAWVLQLSRPSRTSNVRNHRLQATSEVHANLTWIDRKRTRAHLHVRSAEVKNGKAMSARIEGNDTRILRLWQDAHRPRLIELKGLSPDNPYVFPGEALPKPLPGLVLPRGALAPSSFDAMWALGCKHLGVDLGVHRVRHVVATLILAMRPGNFGLVASVLGISEDVARRHYGRDNGEAAAATVREELLRRHPDLMRLGKKRYKDEI